MSLSTNNPESSPMGLTNQNTVPLSSAPLIEQPSSTLALQKFTIFTNLPQEIRLLIWARAAPPPSVISQNSLVDSFGYKYYTHRRGGGVPAILHVCSESRYEFLARDGDDEDALEIRRRVHPVYKLYFKTKRSLGVYMSLDIDSFWCLKYGAKNFNSIRSSNYYCMRHLVITIRGVSFGRPALGSSSFWLSQAELLSLSQHLPRLETLTILIKEREFQMCTYHWVPLAPEVNGNLDESAFNNAQCWLIARVKVFDAVMAELRVKHPTTKFPSLKYRFEQQFMANENMG
ncbi:uncharacterized protein LY89DRAFT_737486 [Mollisia scopiformis]|uniref:2EXR domain-containing protein n=1 Tax=Mollisia scopiformis TaxID=149040 RepID=A0A194X0W6_MOLSC|nr:uncharacterized protein LY89DRAFT_737486 [Mollisia scopiformis]KUJ13507.1 hypothetical protein LY89DRAFT_737486 [Mollisia scopiformis]